MLWENGHLMLNIYLVLLTSATYRMQRKCDADDDIVIYCSNPVRIASIVGYQPLTHMGYSKVRRYSGGIAEWEEAGYPLEGNFVS